jgi:hypothetical protein
MIEFNIHIPEYAPQRAAEKDPQFIRLYLKRSECASNRIRNQRVVSHEQIQYYI